MMIRHPPVFAAEVSFWPVCMLDRIKEASPRLKARIAGVLYLTVIAAEIFAQAFVRDRLERVTMMRA